MNTWVLTERDPWGSLMGWEEQRIETRGFCPPGFIMADLPIRIGLHLSQKLQPADREECYHAPLFRRVLARHGVTFQRRARDYEGDESYDPLGLLPAGHIVAVYTLALVSAIEAPHIPHDLVYECRRRWPGWDAAQELTFGFYAPGRWAYLITDMQLLAVPIPAKGQLGFWRFDLPEAAPRPAPATLVLDQPGGNDAGESADVPHFGASVLDERGVK